MNIKSHKVTLLLSSYFVANKLQSLFSYNNILDSNLLQLRSDFIKQKLVSKGFVLQNLLNTWASVIRLNSSRCSLSALFWGRGEVSHNHPKSCWGTNKEVSCVSEQEWVSSLTWQRWNKNTPDNDTETKCENYPLFCQGSSLLSLFLVGLLPYGGHPPRL